MPKIFAGLIVKNEERDLPKCLKSIESVVDAVVIIDTGSTDDTRKVAFSTISKPVYFKTYLEASEQDEHGDWKLWDFSKARNQFVKMIDALGADYILWMDADDVLLNPEEVRKAIAKHPEANSFACWMTSCGSRWVHHRLWRANCGAEFRGRIHEYPVILVPCVESEITIQHDGAPGLGENSNDRNLRILLREAEEEPTNTRTLFYLANTFKDRGDAVNAVKWYRKRIEVGEAYRDEWLFAYLYMARCQRAAGDDAGALKTLYEAVGHEYGWAEFHMELAKIMYTLKKWDRCIAYCQIAYQLPIPKTNLWREANAYLDLPARFLAHTWNALGDKESALHWAKDAKAMLDGPDESWDNFIVMLGGTTTPVLV